MGEIRDHGGSLAQAEALFADAPKPWIDCSTGITPQPYPVSRRPASAWRLLPEPDALHRLCAAVARADGVRAADNVADAPSTRLPFPLLFALAKPGRAAVLGRTCAEHARCAAMPEESVWDGLAAGLNNFRDRAATRGRRAAG